MAGGARPADGTSNLSAVKLLAVAMAVRVRSGGGGGRTVRPGRLGVHLRAADRPDDARKGTVSATKAVEHTAERRRPAHRFFEPTVKTCSISEVLFSTNIERSFT